MNIVRIVEYKSIIAVLLVNIYKSLNEQSLIYSAHYRFCCEPPGVSIPRVNFKCRC